MNKIIYERDGHLAIAVKGDPRAVQMLYRVWNRIEPHTDASLMELSRMIADPGNVVILMSPSALLLVQPRGDHGFVRIAVSVEGFIEKEMGKAVLEWLKEMFGSLRMETFRTDRLRAFEELGFKEKSVIMEY